MTRPKSLGKASAAASVRALTHERIAQFDEVVELIGAARRAVGRAVDLHLIDLYWKIGALIVGRIKSDGWGKGTVTELASYLGRTQPGSRGFSPPNLWRMRQFYETYGGSPKLAALTRGLPWSSNLHILSGSRTDEEREFYLRMAVEMRWNVREVARQIDAGAFESALMTSPKLSTTLRELHPDVDRIFKDAYAIEFAGLAPNHSEADLHGALLANLGRFITELGRDFCFVGSQYPVQVGNRDFAIDLVFFHRTLQCLVAFELKVGRFEPEHLGKLAFYVEALDRNDRKPHERPSVGVLLCASKDNEVVEFTLARTASPTLVAEYRTALPPKEVLRAKLHELYALAASAKDGEAIDVAPSKSRTRPVRSREQKERKKR